MLTTNNLKSSISEKTGLPELQFKMKWGQKYLMGTERIEELGIKDGDAIEIKLGLKGG